MDILEGLPLHSLCDNLPSYYKNVWSPPGREYVFTEVVVSHCGWTRVVDHKNATIVWTTGHSDMPADVKASLRLGRGQIWSQLEDGWVFADKVRLHKLLRYVNHLEYQPPTFILTDPSECVSFFQLAAQEPTTVWVSKEPSNSQGMGITVNPDVNQLKQLWLVDPEAQPQDYKCKIADRDDVLIQRYLLDPLLLEGKKMEIRSYWVVASTNPYVILYHDGTVRLTTREYKLDDWSDPLIHITNTRQQKDADPNYYLTEAERKWTIEKLATYLKQEGKLKETEEEWLNRLREMLKERIAVAAMGAHEYLTSKQQVPGWDGRFELFGMDVILDQNLYPWLTELQDGPGLSLDPGVKQYVIPKIIKELVNVILEIDATLRAGRPLNHPLQSLGGWHYIDLQKYSHLVANKIGNLEK
eukprot:TRINITY_DN7329_c0_g1_i1.p1 TRINITY_DN7329_c0_g1~~TRINITY_DN7329_c0_g1_i1.p1  ORF type:complete len:427 (+),score=84.72 TRINITY_DN7329_c0_g1_i1:43-1281(+)